jgi:4-amino-4-deoxy-L-arabinose transferase-like glycosyltransferase
MSPGTEKALSIQVPTDDTIPLPWSWWLRWLFVLIVVGVGWRLLRYFLQFPIWGDEALLCLNFPNHTFAGILKGVDHCVVAPIFFLWGELSVYQWLGGSELALRLIPVLAGLAVLPLFWRLARQVVDAGPATLAIGILAVAYYPVRHGCEIRPYSLDLLIATLFLLGALAWLQRPQRVGLLVFLCFFPFLGLGFSNTLVFVAGGVSLALLPTLWRQPLRVKLIWLAYNLSLGIAFVGYLAVNTGMQTEGSMEFLHSHWGHAFPPGEPLALLKWLVEAHTGNIMAYPVGGKFGTSTLTLVLFLVGVWHFARDRRWDVLCLCLVPFVLTLIAAALRRYPYGDSARHCQHLAPAICLLTGTGLYDLISKLCRTYQSKRWAVSFACGTLALIGLAGIARDLWHPFKTTADQQGRQIAGAVLKQAEPDSPVVLLSTDRESQAEMLWYLFLDHPQVQWKKDVDWEALSQKNRLVCVRFTVFDGTKPEPAPAPFPELGTWHPVGRKIYSRPLSIGVNLREMVETLEYRHDAEQARR